MAINDGIGNDVRDPFPGIRLPAGTGAPGSGGASGQAADNTSAGPVSLPQLGTWQSTSRYDAQTSGTVMPEQVAPNVITPDLGGSFSDTGAGQGHTDAWARRPWQEGG